MVIHRGITQLNGYLAGRLCDAMRSMRHLSAPSKACKDPFRVQVATNVVDKHAAVVDYVGLFSLVILTTEACDLWAVACSD